MLVSPSFRTGVSLLSLLLLPASAPTHAHTVPPQPQAPQCKYAVTLDFGTARTGFAFARLGSDLAGLQGGSGGCADGPDPTPHLFYRYPDQPAHAAW